MLMPVEELQVPSLSEVLHRCFEPGANSFALLYAYFLSKVGLFTQQFWLPQEYDGTSWKPGEQGAAGRFLVMLMGARHWLDNARDAPSFAA